MTNLIEKIVNIMRFNLLFFLGGYFILLSNASAVVITWPLLERVEVEYHQTDMLGKHFEGRFKAYLFPATFDSPDIHDLDMKMSELHGSSWATEFQFAAVYTPNKTQTMSHWDIHPDKEGFNGESTAREWIDYVNKKHPAGSYIEFTIYNIDFNFSPCVKTGMETRYGSSGILFTRNYGAPHSSSCMSAPPASGSCDIETKEISFDYGTLIKDKAEGEMREADLELTCTMSMKYALRLRFSDSNIELSNGMKAQIKAEGLPLDSTLTSKQGTNIIKLTSQLSGTPTNSGQFYGTGVLLISFP